MACCVAGFGPLAMGAVSTSAGHAPVSGEAFGAPALSALGRLSAVTAHALSLHHPLAQRP